MGVGTIADDGSGVIFGPDGRVDGSQTAVDHRPPLDNDDGVAVPTLGPIMVWVMMLLVLFAGQYGLKRLSI